MLQSFNFFLLFICIALSQTVAADKPNFVIILTDDQGYGDLGCFGSTKIKTPNIDRMAREGRKFTSFMVASSLCTPSRAALLTGCYPKRVGLHQGVLFPSSRKGLNPAELTIADHLKTQGYATACIGKWHLGHHRETLPNRQGFDSYFGIPYSNDMNHPDNQGKPKGGVDGMDILWNEPGSTLSKWKTPLMENSEIVELPVDQRTVTRRYTDRAIEFIKANKERPFFLYLPHTMPHIPLYVPDDVYDPDPNNAYTCVIEHIDAEVGRLINTIRDLSLDKNTIVIYTSDNGPWLPFKHHGGSAGRLRAGKGTTFEGGQRVPCVIWGPGQVPAGAHCDQLVSTMDVLPTIAALTKTPLPKDLKIDGVDISELLMNEQASTPRSEFLFYASNGKLEGIRAGDWKLLRKKTNKEKQGSDVQEGEKFDIKLFNLAQDVSEKQNVAHDKPELVKQLTKRMLELDAEVTANARVPWFKPKQNVKEGESS